MVVRISAVAIIIPKLDDTGTIASVGARTTYRAVSIAGWLSAISFKRTAVSGATRISRIAHQSGKFPDWTSGDRIVGIFGINLPPDYSIGGKGATRSI